MTRRMIAKFYSDVSTAPVGGGYTVLLDSKPVKTPGRVAMVLPTPGLAEAVAQEWHAQDKQVDTARMPLTGLAYVALELVARQRGRVIDHCLGYGRSDLLCYRAETPPELKEWQAETWDPLLQWIAETHSIQLQSGVGVSYIEQPAGAILGLEKLVTALGDFELAALDRTVSLTGSLVLGLAVLDQRISAAEAFTAAHVDEDFQAEKWGRDAEAEQRLAHIRGELEAAGHFVRLARTQA